MTAEDFILKIVLPVLAAVLAFAVPLYLARRKEPLDNKASAASTEGGVLDNYNKLADRLTLYEERMAIMRTQLNTASDTIEKQQDEINELNKAAVRYGNELDTANKATADYKGKYDVAVIEIKGCRALAEKASSDLQDAFRRIDILETELRRLGVLSEQEGNGKRIEQVIEDAKTLTDAPPSVDKKE